MHRPVRAGPTEANSALTGAPLVVRVVPDVVGIDKEFDYLVPEKWRDLVAVGTIVRVALQGRRVRAWVVAVGVTPLSGVTLKPIAKVTGAGPSADLIELGRWASWRWAGHLVHLLDTASPPGALPVVRGFGASTAEDARQNGRGVTVVRVPPGADDTSAIPDGPVLVVTPSVARAGALARMLGAALVPRDWARAAAGRVSVVGARAAAWVPAPDVSAIVVLDEHDEGLKEERVPAWHARDVAIERARRAGIPCVLVSPCPSLEALAAADRVVTPSTNEERSGWPILDVVDRRSEDIRTSGLFSPRLATLVRDRDRGRVICVLNRLGRSRLLACDNCGEVVRCERCDAAVEQLDDSTLHCRRCEATRPMSCLNCGGTRARNLRVGVARAREELEALAGEPVAEVTGRTDGDPGTRVVVGTEAVLHHIRPPVGAVVFLDIDQELLAPRYRAAEEGLSLLARAARLLGPRSGGGRLVAQTRNPRHPVLDAVLHADPGRFSARERARRDELGFPPARALAAVSGKGAPEFVDTLGMPLGVDVLGPADDRWLLRSIEHSTLCDALAATPRPAARTRIEVDPLRV